MTLSQCQAPATQFAQPWQCDSQKTLTRHVQVQRLPRKMTMEITKVMRLPRKNLKTTQKYCACHKKRLSTCYETCLHVTKCHVCHAKRGYAMFEASKKWSLLQNSPEAPPYGPHADGCGRLRNVWRAHLQPTTPHAEWNGSLCYASGKQATDSKSEANKVDGKAHRIHGPERISKDKSSRRHRPNMAQ